MLFGQAHIGIVPGADVLDQACGDSPSPRRVEKAVGAIDVLVHRRHRGDALAHIELDLARDGLHLQERAHRLEIVLHPVMDLAEQHFIVGKRR